MAKLIIRENPGNNYNFGCYSERGIISYLIFRYLTSNDRLLNFLQELSFPGEEQNPFLNINIKAATLFSELNFGKFGSPDGAIFITSSKHVENDPINSMIFFGRQSK